MAADGLEVCNIGLSLVGANPIESFLEESTEARWCNTNYEALKAAVLCERAWAFAERFLAVTGTVTAQGTYLYPLPDGALHILRCYESVSPVIQANWRRTSDGIEADFFGKLWVLHTTDVHETVFPPMFTQALAARLAMEMAIPIARSNALLGTLVQMYEQKLVAAAAADGIEGRSERHDSTELISCRQGGYTI